MPDKKLVLKYRDINRQVGEGAPPFVIAEIGSNHNQDLVMAKEMIHISAECGADAVKFQTLSLIQQYASSRFTNDLKELHQRIDMDEKWYPALAEESYKAGVLFCSAPTYPDALNLLEAVEVPLYKLGSPQVRTFPSLVKKVAALGKPVFMSIGYSNYGQIEAAVNACAAAENQQYVLLHCVSEYPTKYETVNLNTMTSIAKMFDCLVGLSDHTPGHAVPCASVALGAAVVEKHITLDRTLPGPDHHFAMEPKEFQAMVQEVRNVYMAMGSHVKQVTEHEKRLGEELMVKWYAKRDIHSGEIIDENAVAFLRGDQGIDDSHYMLLGRIKAVQTISQGEAIIWPQVEHLTAK